VSAQFVIIPPPSTNTGYKLGIRQTARGPKARMMKTPELKTWEFIARAVCRGYTPPHHTPLAMTIDLYLPKNQLRRKDIDGGIKFLTDMTVGRRHDQWVDKQIVRKHLTDGEAYVIVSIEEL
jgi:hypothetical protein